MLDQRRTNRIETAKSLDRLAFEGYGWGRWHVNGRIETFAKCDDWDGLSGRISAESLQ